MKNISISFKPERTVIFAIHLLLIEFYIHHFENISYVNYDLSYLLNIQLLIIFCVCK